MTSPALDKARVPTPAFRAKLGKIPNGLPGGNPLGILQLRE